MRLNSNQRAVYGVLLSQKAFIRVQRTLEKFLSGGEIVDPRGFPQKKKKYFGHMPVVIFTPSRDAVE